MKKERISKANLLARNSIVNALLELVKTKPMKAISITELTAKAGVSRMTFYRNYDSIESVLADRLKEIMARYREEDKDDAGIYYDHRRMRRCFRYFAEYRDFLEGLLGCGMGEVFLKSLTSYMTSRWIRDVDDLKERLKMSAFAGILYNVYMQWTAEGYRQTEDEMAAMIEEICRAGFGV